MRKLLMGAGYMMSTSAEWEIVKDIKLGFLASRYFKFIGMQSFVEVFSLLRQYVPFSPDFCDQV